MIARLAAVFGALVTLVAASTAPAQPYRAALDAAMRDTCNRQVVMLGETTHGDGTTVAFKAALIERLVSRCGFKAVFFEASFYDFLALDRKLRAREPAGPELLQAAVGGLWRYDAEFQPLVPFLLTRAAAGQLALGGIDDQVGAAGSFYANDAMPLEVTEALPEPRRSECRTLFHQRLYWQFEGGYQPAHRAALRACAAAAMGATAASAGDPVTRGERLQMLANIDRQLARDLGPTEAYIVARDRSMYLNFQWLAERLPPGTKIIVWAANAHIAADATASGEYAGPTNLGAFIKQAYGARAFALGISALSGSFRWSRQEPSRALPAALPGSLETLALAGGRADSTYLGNAALKRLGVRNGVAFDYAKPAAIDWSRAFDGLVVLRAQHPPQRIDAPLKK